jgi:isoquinoline 1-oxidoreductase subunit beta
MSGIKVDRRSFLVSSGLFGGGMALGVSPALAAEPKGALPNAPWATGGTGGVEMHPWILIAPDDVVTIRVPTPECGNGAATQVAMNVCEELHCDWSKVNIEFASVRRDHLEKGIYTVGRQPMFSGHGTDPERMPMALQLGASARERLQRAAAARWKVWQDEVEAKDSVLIHRPTGRTLRFGEVAAEAANILVHNEPDLKSQEEWTFLGKASPPKLTAPAIADGTAVYGIDVKVPNMVHAALKQCPVHGGKLKRHDPKAVLGMPGVRAVVVVDPVKTRGAPRGLANPVGPGMVLSTAQSGVAVIADHYWQAKKALEALPVEWDMGSGGKFADEKAVYAQGRAVLAKGKGTVVRARGEVAAAKAGRVLEATYATPWCENAAMEPLNGTALVTADKVEMWVPAQDQHAALWVAVDETGLTPDKVDMHQTLIGGAFGRRTASDDVRMVVAVAKEYPGVPVKTIWSREETMAQGRFRTPIMTRFKAVIDKDGMPQAFTAHTILGGLIAMLNSLEDTPYVVSGAIPNAEISSSFLPYHVQTGAYRGPCYNSHAFMVESFIDECAAAAKADPLEYRIKLLQTWDPAWTGCLKKAAEKSGWGKSLPKGDGRGIAIANWPNAGLRKNGTTVCCVVHAAVSPAGELSVKQVDVTFDCGRIANRDAVAAQLEGGVIFGLNAAINEEITLKNGAVVESNFDSYPIMRIGDIPPVINIHFDALSGDDRFQPVGEAPVGPIAAALGNAIFAATGKRLRQTPFRKAKLNWT